MNDSFGISKKSCKCIKKTINLFPDIEKVIIFGSRAKGNYKKGSDIDLAIYGNKLKKNTALNLAAILNEEKPLPYYVDVMAPDHLNNQDLAAHINRVGILFYENKN